MYKKQLTKINKKAEYKMHRQINGSVALQLRVFYDKIGKMQKLEQQLL